MVVVTRLLGRIGEEVLTLFPDSISHLHSLRCFVSILPSLEKLFQTQTVHGIPIQVACLEQMNTEKPCLQNIILLNSLESKAGLLYQDSSLFINTSFKYFHLLLGEELKLTNFYFKDHNTIGIQKVWWMNSVFCCN